MGLIEGGAPEDEHDYLTGKIISLLYSDKIEEIRPFLINCYERYGSSVNDIKEEYQESFNRKIDNAYRKIKTWYFKYQDERIK